MSFRYSVQEPFTMARGATVSVWMDCHRPTPGATNPLAEGTAAWRFTLYRNGEEVATYDGSGEPPTPVGTCYEDGGVPGWRYNGVFEPSDIVFEPGDTMDLEMAFFNWVSPGNTTYLKVDGFNGPSVLYGVGLPGTVRSSPSATLGVDVPNATVRAGPGNATTRDIAVVNDGNSTRAVGVEVDGPADWPMVASPSSFEIPAGEEVSLDLTVAAPPDAVPNTTATHTVALKGDTEETAFETTTRAVPGTGSPTDLVSTDDGAGGGLPGAGEPHRRRRGRDGLGGGRHRPDRLRGLGRGPRPAIVATIAAVVGVAWD